MTAITDEYKRQMCQWFHFVERALSLAYLDPLVNPDAATWGSLSMILALQYGVMLNLSGEIAQVQLEMSHIWLRVYVG
jgi:hypothetical protein